MNPPTAVNLVASPGHDVIYGGSPEVTAGDVIAGNKADCPKPAIQPLRKESKGNINSVEVVLIEERVLVPVDIGVAIPDFSKDSFIAAWSVVEDRPAENKALLEADFVAFEGLSCKVGEADPIVLSTHGKRFATGDFIGFNELFGAQAVFESC